jgi:3-dehydroquinate dehydratase / shikimate dehydrogenase
MPTSTLLCVPIMVQDEPSAQAEAFLARDLGADLIEFRIDGLFTGALDVHGELDERELAIITRLVKGSPLPCVVTCRAASEGGEYDGDDSARVSMYQHLGTAGARGDVAPNYVDIEHATYQRSANLRQKMHLAVDFDPARAAKDAGGAGGGAASGAGHRAVTTRLVLSMHDFTGRPSDLTRRVLGMQLEPAARVVKFAFLARSLRDNLEVFDLLRSKLGETQMIGLAMGQFGLMSRVLAPKFGGFLTFASLRKQSTTAPGQPTVSELLDQYRFRDINTQTRVLGVVGWPVEHSLSPLIHNAGLESLRPDTWERAPAELGAHNAVYLPLPVPPEYEHFKATLSALVDHEALDFAGCSVTLPHKQHLVKFAIERAGQHLAGMEPAAWTLDDLSRLSGAANTLVLDRDVTGALTSARILNTDAEAAREVLVNALAGASVRGVCVGLLGAGGVARAIAAGLVLAGAEVVVVNRTPENAQTLVADLTRKLGELDGSTQGRLRVATMDELADMPIEAIVNATPIGMKGGPAPTGSPLDRAVLERLAAGSRSSSGCIVFDTIYTPIETPLLVAARELGLRPIDGLEMFVRQAGRQFEAWTGQAAPLGLFRRLAREALGVSGA